MKAAYLLKKKYVDYKIKIFGERTSAVALQKKKVQLE